MSEKQYNHPYSILDDRIRVSMRIKPLIALKTYYNKGIEKHDKGLLILHDQVVSDFRMLQDEIDNELTLRN